MSAIVAISQSRVLDRHITSGSVDADVFRDFVDNSLSPVVQPFIGINHISVVILDNAVYIHHVDSVIDSLQNTGVIVQFLPPYCPDLDAVEEECVCTCACVCVCTLV